MLQSPYIGLRNHLKCILFLINSTSWTCTKTLEKIFWSTIETDKLQIASKSYSYSLLYNIVNLV